MKSLPSLLLLTVLGLLMGCKAQPAAVQQPSEPTYLNLSEEATYVGIEKCKTCHPTQYATYTESEMGRSFKKATLQNSAARFDDVRPVYDPHKDFYYLPFHRGENLFVKEFRLAGRDTVFQRVEQIDYIVGSGQHTNSHIMEENGYLYQVPLTWYAQDGRWDLPPGFDAGNNSRFGRPIPVQCMTCHNAMATFVPGSQNRYTAVPHGIDCERCHGPGSLHVEEKWAGIVADTANGNIDPTIVNPGKLPYQRQLDVCQRCHVQGATVFEEGKTAFDFRPGQRLADVANVYLPRYADSTESFIMASHPDRLQMSSCFQQSHVPDNGYEPITCITCHNPHVSIKSLGQDHYNQVCASCHTPEKDNLCAEDIAVRARKQDNCVACHMAVSGSSDIPHIRITDHYIRTFGRSESLFVSASHTTKEDLLVGIASLVEPNPTNRDIAEGYLANYEERANHPEFLDSAAVYLEKARGETPPLVLARSQIRLWFWQKDYEAITDLVATLNTAGIEDPWTLYRMGEAFSQTGQIEEAVDYLERAVTLSPHHLPFQNKLAGAYNDLGQYEHALSLYNAILEANPKYEDAYNDRGFTRIALGDIEGAEADFRAALALNPDIAMALGNLASLYYNTDRKAEARPYVRRLLALEPDNPNYQQFWNLVNTP